MSNAPKHRAPGRHKAARKSSATLRRMALATGVAALATGVAVAGGVSESPSTTPVAAKSTAATDTATTDAADSDAPSQALERRAAKPVVSRADRRGKADPTKAVLLDMGGGAAVSGSETLSAGDPRDIARALLAEYGFAATEFDCLDALYVGESNWRVDADNPNSSAYGIPQALTQLHDLPADYMTSAEAQIRWGLDYIKGRYGTPCNAYAFKRSRGFY